MTGLRTGPKPDMELLLRDLVIMLGRISVVGVGVLLATVRDMPVHLLPAGIATVFRRPSAVNQSSTS
jgi:hypothetical protein